MHRTSVVPAYLALLDAQREAIFAELAIGCLNMIQALQVGVHHDAHHFATIRRLLE